MKTYEELKNEAIEMLENDDELYCNVVDELDSWNGFADGFRCYPMDELDDIYCGCPASKIINDITEDFHINDNYFYFSIWGLESTDDKVELYKENTTTEDIVDRVVKIFNDINISYLDKDFEELIKNMINCENN